MKFFHVTGYSKITGTKGGHNVDYCKNMMELQNPYDYYKFFLDLSTKTAERYIDEENYERVILSGEYYQIAEAHRDNIKKLYKLWKDNYPCNILYTGPDVFFLQKVKFSDKFKEFSLFQYCQGLEKNPKFGMDVFFDCDIRYFPSTMSESLWYLALELEQRWPSYDTVLGEWEFEGYIWNAMLWSQDFDKDHFQHPEYSFQYAGQDLDSSIEYNKIPIEDVKLVHCHGSRLWNLYPKIEALYKRGVFPEDLWLELERKVRAQS
jgi:hypothetical protein